jgi:hypothetical protein
MEAPSPGLQKWVFYSFAVLVGAAVIALGYAGLHPPSGLKADYDLDVLRFKWYGLAVAVGLAVSFWFLLKRKWKAFFLSWVGVFVSLVLFTFLTVMPLVNPYRSTKGLAQKMNRMLYPGETFVSFLDLKESSLFYTDHKALLIKSPEELRILMGQEKRFFCIMRKIHLLRDVQLQQSASIIDEEGGKVLILNRK